MESNAEPNLHNQIFIFLPNKNGRISYLGKSCSLLVVIFGLTFSAAFMMIFQQILQFLQKIYRPTDHPTNQPTDGHTLMVMR